MSPFALSFLPLSVFADSKHSLPFLRETIDTEIAKLLPRVSDDVTDYYSMAYRATTRREDDTSQARESPIPLAAAISHTTSTSS